MPWRQRINNGAAAARWPTLLDFLAERLPTISRAAWALRLSRGDICTEPDSFPYFQPRIMLIQDRDQRLVLAGEIRAGIILWQQPVASDAEARRIVTEASRLRSMAFRASDPGDARRLRYRAAALETRLVDPFWRETSADLLRLPQAA